jgi:Fe-S oxidoreductase
MEKNFERGVEILRSQIDGRVAAYLSSCVRCGMCADACLFYTETQDPRYTPIHKLEPLRKLWRREHTLWGRLGAALGLGESLSEHDFADWEELVYDSCTMCGRCTMVCPVGNDIAYMLRWQREGFSGAGYSPEGLQGATERALETGSPMGVTFKALKAQIQRVEEETGLEVPVDREGAEYMSLLSSLEIMGFPEYISAITRIFHQAGVSWTLSSRTFEATNSGIQIGDSKVAAELVQRVVDAAEALNVKRVISPECGHAYTAIRWEGANLIGRSLPFEVVHILELLDELRADGRLRTQASTTARVTFHDPCNLARKGGVIEPQRRLLDMVASDFVEMRDHGAMNWCCGGGGGVSANERAKPLRITAFARKKAQLDEIGAEVMVTACANCRNMLEDGLDAYDMDMEVLGLTELLAEHLVTGES